MFFRSQFWIRIRIITKLYHITEHREMKIVYRFDIDVAKTDENIDKKRRQMGFPMLKSATFNLLGNPHSGSDPDQT